MTPTENYNRAIASMQRWRDVEKWALYAWLAAPLLLFLIPLDKFFLGWFLLLAFTVYAHCYRIQWRERSAVIYEQLEEPHDHAQTDHSN